MQVHYVGQSLKRFEDHRLLTGGGSYLDDMTMPNSGSHVSGVRPIAGSRFAAGLLGYMRLEFRSGGRIQLSVVAECSVEAVEANLCRAGEAGRFRSVCRARVR